MPVITGTGQSDTLNGTEDPDLIRALNGDDYAFGAGGDDQIEGGEGRDYLDGGLGNDLLLGGADDDTLFEGASGGSDSFYGEDGNDSLLHSAYMAAAVGAVVLLDGGAGDDVIRQYSSVETSVTLVGGAGNDRIDTSGSGGHIAIDAGADADFIEISHSGSTDFDIALGSGADLLFISTGVFSPASDGAITVSDFAVGDGGDMLGLVTYVVRHTGFRDFAGNPFATGHARVIQRGADAVLQTDTDGAGSGAGFIDLVVLQNVSAAALTARNLGGYAASGAATAGVTVDGSAITDMLSATSGNDLVYGNGGDDILFGGAGNDRLEGGAGHDRIEGDLGNDLLYGGDGNDILRESVSGNSDQLFGEGGNDSLFADRQWYDVGFTSVVLDGGVGLDNLTFLGRVGLDDATLLGGDGDDGISAGVGRNVTIDAGAGADIVNVDLGIANAVITLGAGADLLYLSVFQAPVVGFTVLDFEAGDTGDRIGLGTLATLFSGWDPMTNPFAENYLRLGRQGADTLLLYDASGEGAYFTIAGRLAGLDPAGLTAFNLGYAPGPIAIAGTDGADSLTGTAGTDELIGFAGNDLLNGQAGADRMLGGLGNDIYVVDSLSDVIVEGLGEGDDIIYTSVNHGLGAGVHVETLAAGNQAGLGAINLVGNEFGQSIFGNQGNNIILGNGGVDQLIGFGGNDILVGGTGADVMRGGLGNDQYGIDEQDLIFEAAGEGNDTLAANIGSYFLNAGASIETLTTANQAGTGAQNLTGNEIGQSIAGSAGANVLNGLGGLDLLRGYGGADIFLFDTAPDSATNYDVIADMVVGVDKIALQNSVFTGLTEGNLGVGQFVIGTAAQDADDRIVYNQANGHLYFDADGNGAGAAVLFAIVNGPPSLTAADFMII